MGRLLETRGPGEYRDDLEWSIVGSVQGPIVSRRGCSYSKGRLTLV
jgi:hypothetical protein